MKGKRIFRTEPLRFKHFTRKGYALFACLGRVVLISVLAVSTLTFATASGIAVHTEFISDGDTKAVQYATLDISEIQDGDLLFELEGNGSAFTQAITGSTTGAQGLDISHVAIFQKGKRAHYYIIDATPSKGVAITEIHQFHQDSLGTTAERVFLVGRVKDRKIARKATEKAIKYLNKSYDRFFIPNDSAIYCSELVQLSYIRKDGTPLFPCIPMSFHDASGAILPYWTEYYGKSGLEVPEGQPGTNPGEMSRSKEITIIGELKIEKI